jgi:hypothetical protein
MPTNEKYLSLEFPLKGLDLNEEFEEQPPSTTPLGNNVRARDVLELRLRGGQRPGLVKYIPQQIPEGAVLIQHLDYIVDPSEAALTQNFTDPDDTWIEITPGVWVPPGGAGWQPNPNVTQPAPGGLRFIQKKEGSLSSNDDPGGVLTLTLDTLPTTGDTILVCIRVQSSWLGDQITPVDPFSSVTVKNGAATSYAQQGATILGQSGDLVLDPFNPQQYQWNRLRFYLLRSTGIASDQTVIVTQAPGSTGEEPGAGMYVEANALVYRKMDVAPLIAVNGFNINLQSQTTINAGNVAVQEGCALIGFVCNFSGASYTPSMTLRASGSIGILVADRFPMHFPADKPTNVNATSGGDNWPVIIAGTFKKAP